MIPQVTRKTKGSENMRKKSGGPPERSGSGRGRNRKDQKLKRNTQTNPNYSGQHPQMRKGKRGKRGGGPYQWE